MQQRPAEANYLGACTAGMISKTAKQSTDLKRDAFT